MNKWIYTQNSIKFNKDINSKIPVLIIDNVFDKELDRIWNEIPKLKLEFMQSSKHTNELPNWKE